MGLWNLVQTFFGDDPEEAEIAEKNFAVLDEADPEMAAAWEQARATVSEFVAHTQDPNLENAAFFVKKRFVQGDRSEHLWLQLEAIEDGVFLGIVGNDPQVVSNVASGQQARVPFGEITDWMITSGDDMIGGFTVAVYAQRAEG